MERRGVSSYSDASSMASSSSDQSLSITSDQTSPLVTPTMLSRTSSSSSSAVGDYIGTESCFDVLFADEENDIVSTVSEPVRSRFRYGGRRREEREARAAAAREFPPPIPLLAQTENLLPHMPWVLKRVVTSDGRLILREEKVRHHEYFRANRSNGRLTLQLVPLDDDVFEIPQEPVTDDEDGEESEDDECHDNLEVENDLDDLADDINKSVIISGSNDDKSVIISGSNDDKSVIISGSNDDKSVIISGSNDDKSNVHGDSHEDGYRKVKIATEETAMESRVMVGGGGSPRGKCLKSCFVGIRVREIRPVLS